MELGPFGASVSACTRGRRRSAARRAARSRTPAVCARVASMNDPGPVHGLGSSVRRRNRRNFVVSKLPTKHPLGRASPGRGDVRGSFLRQLVERGRTLDRAADRRREVDQGFAGDRSGGGPDRRQVRSPSPTTGGRRTLAPRATLEITPAGGLALPPDAVRTFSAQNVPARTSAARSCQPRAETFATGSPSLPTTTRRAGRPPRSWIRPPHRWS